MLEKIQRSLQVIKGMGLPFTKIWNALREPVGAEEITSLILNLLDSRCQCRHPGEDGKVGSFPRSVTNT